MLSTQSLLELEIEARLNIKVDQDCKAHHLSELSLHEWDHICDSEMEMFNAVCLIRNYSKRRKETKLLVSPFIHI